MSSQAISGKHDFTLHHQSRTSSGTLNGRKIKKWTGENTGELAAKAFITAFAIGLIGGFTAAFLLPAAGLSAGASVGTAVALFVGPIVVFPLLAWGVGTLLEKRSARKEEEAAALLSSDS